MYHCLPERQDRMVCSILVFPYHMFENTGKAEGKTLGVRDFIEPGPSGSSSNRSDSLEELKLTDGMLCDLVSL